MCQHADPTNFGDKADLNRVSRAFTFVRGEPRWDWYDKGLRVYYNKKNRKVLNTKR